VDRGRLLKDAWIGDAVLTLHARLRILKQHGIVDGQMAERMTSNQFLSTHGEPSETEAIIGRIYLDAGLDAAFAWIDRELIPLFERQEANRRKK
jgi:dsRNA-specific ribonuclease